MNPLEPLFHLPGKCTSLLDIGCNIGQLLEKAEDLGVQKLTGIDINKKAIEIAKKNHEHRPAYSFFHGSADELPFNDSEFEAVICTEVLEHIPSEFRPKMIDEIQRVLTPKGRLILTTPFYGAFHFLDPSNVRFHFPNTYKFLNSIFKNKGRDEGFEGEKHGVIKHHHFKEDEIDNLFANKFEIKTKKFRGCLLTPLGEWILFPAYRFKAFDNLFFKGIKKLQGIEMRNEFPKQFAYNILISSDSLK